jgi:hypothetical protein
MNVEGLMSEYKETIGITTDKLDTRLLRVLKAAAASIMQEGITDLDPEDELDGELIIDYAAWAWEKRRENVPIPRMLRWRLNNRLFALKME